MLHVRSYSLGILVGIVMACVAPLWGAPIITNLGTLSGSTGSMGMDVSADGKVVAGICVAPAGNHAFRWTLADGMLDLGDAGYTSNGYSASNDGSAIVGDVDAYGLKAFRWQAGTGMGYIPWWINAQMAGRGISGDGSTVVGWALNPGLRAFRYTAADGLQDLGTMGTATSVAYGTSDDGSVVVGYVDGPRAYRWTSATGMQDLGLGGGTSSAAFKTSADGSVVVGWMGIDYQDHAMRWTAADGMQNLGTLEAGAGATSYAFDVSSDGGFIVGAGTVGGANHAMLWSAPLGMVDLNTYLPTLGVDLTGWTLSEARGVSTDGAVLVGTGIYLGETRAWLVTVPEPGSISISILGLMVLLRRSRR